MDFPHKLKKSLRYQLAPFPRLFIPFYQLLAPARNRSLLISKGTELVIEGYPRSGNTFAVVAFLQAQPNRVKIAHHLHAEAQVLEGVRQKLPVLVLIREPTAAIRSLMIRHSDVKASFAMKHYIRFYTTISKFHKQIVIADFNEITTDFGKVVKRMNRKFGVSFIPFNHTAENVERVFQEIEQINQAVDSGKESHVARPSKERQQTYEKLDISFPETLQEEATHIYKQMLLYRTNKE